MLACLLLLAALKCGSVNQSRTIYTLAMSSPEDALTEGEKLGVTHAIVTKEQPVQGTTVGAKTVAKLMNLKKYQFKTNGTEYTLYPLDRIMQGSRCIGKFWKIMVKKDKIILLHKDGDICAGGAKNYSTIVEIHPGKEQVAHKSLLTDSGNFKFKLGITELLDEIYVKRISLMLPFKANEDEKEENEKDDYENEGHELIHAVSKTGKPFVIKITKNNDASEASKTLNKNNAKQLLLSAPSNKEKETLNEAKKQNNGKAGAGKNVPVQNRKARRKKQRTNL